MLKYSASYILFLLVLIVTLFTGATGAGVAQWTPKRKDLEVMSLRSAVIVNGVTLLIIAGLFYLIVRAFQS